MENKIIFFEWKIWWKKVALEVLKVIVAGGMTVYTNNPYWMIVLPIIKGLENYIKHH